MQEQYAPTAETSLKGSTNEPLLIGCPVCGRPAKIRQQLVGEELACGHCRSTFVVTERMDGSKSVRSTTSTRRPTEPKTPRPTMTTLQSRDRDQHPQPKKLGEAKSRPVAFVVESRDEVYARLAGDLTEAGCRVVRALSATDALKACGKYRPRLVVAQFTLPKQAAWQLAPKLAMLDSDTQVVLYGDAIAIHDYAMADFLGIEQLIEYGGDLFRLSTQIRQWLGSKSPEQTESTYRSVA